MNKIYEVCQRRGLEVKPTYKGRIRDSKNYLKFLEIQYKLFGYRTVKVGNSFTAVNQNEEISFIIREYENKNSHDSCK